MYILKEFIETNDESSNSNFIPTNLIKWHCKSLYNLQLVYKLLMEIGKISTLSCCTFYSSYLT